ncbi:MAG: HlyD family secretion protein [Abditibacteriales bacterium]|nr:HlyD family secretion protein [Abditibacteriales bacterium]
MSTHLPNIRAPRRKWLRRFIAKYIGYVEVIGYLFVVVAVAGIVTCWFVKVDDTAKADATPAIKPRTAVVKDDQHDVVVVKVLVDNHAAVKAGQPLVRVCRDPQSGDLDTSEANLVEMTAPIAGVVDGVKDLEGKVIPKGKDICRVLDFNDLCLTVKLIGENVPKARVGQKAHIEILPDYGRLPLYVRGTVVWGRFDKQHVQFNDLLDDADKEAIKKQLESATITLRDDIPLTFTDILNLWVDSTLTPQAVANGAPSATATIPVETLAHLNPLQGTLIEGKHTGKMELRDVPEDVKEELRRRLLQKLQGKVVLANDRPFRVQDIQDLRPAIQLKIETLDPTETAEELERKLRNARVAAKIERFYEGTVQIKDPPLELRTLVQKLHLQDKPIDIKTNVWVVVAQRRVAMLLFRR